MSNYVSDSEHPDTHEYACFSHLFGRERGREWVSLWLTDPSYHGQFYIDDFLKHVIPEDVWEHITVETLKKKHQFLDYNGHSIDKQFKWKVTFDGTKLDAGSVFYALTLFRYPQEFPAMTGLYYSFRQTSENKDLCFMAAHLARHLLDNLNHTFTHWTLFNTGIDALQKYQFKQQWPNRRGLTYIQCTQKERIYSTFRVTNGEPYSYARKLPDKLVDTFVKIFGPEHFGMLLKDRKPALEAA